MSNRTFRALTSSPLTEQAEDTAALAGHVAYDKHGNGEICRCEIETEHDSSTGSTLSMDQIVARKTHREEVSR